MVAKLRVILRVVCSGGCALLTTQACCAAEPVLFHDATSSWKFDEPNGAGFVTKGEVLVQAAPAGNDSSTAGGATFLGGHLRLDPGDPRLQNLGRDQFSIALRASVKPDAWRGTLLSRQTADKKRGFRFFVAEEKAGRSLFFEAAFNWAHARNNRPLSVRLPVDALRGDDGKTLIVRFSGPQAVVLKTAGFTGNRRLGAAFVPFNFGSYAGHLLFREIVQDGAATFEHVEVKPLAEMP